MAPRGPIKPPSRPPHDRQVLLLTLLGGVPAVAAALLLVWIDDHTEKVRWSLSLDGVASWVAGALSVRERVVSPLQTLSNMLAALREGDYSIRARGAREDDALGLALLEVNTMADTLRAQRLGALEATELLRTVMAEIDVAVFAFDEAGTLRLVNRAGERLLGQPGERLLGRPASALGLAECIAEPPRVVSLSFPGGVGRWEVRRSTFRQGGVVHQLLVLADVSRALREEEREAWQRLIRVLGHEINNSLAPIKSIAASLSDLVGRESRPPRWEEDLRQGLGVVEGRADALSRFMSAYARLARLPRPRFADLDVETWVRRVTGLETRVPVGVVPGPRLTVQADGDQLDQLLINLVRNAADAALETGGGAEVGWNDSGDRVEVWVEDEGPGLSDTGNLFVPFFTTKPSGSGIGLALSRQIAEAHGGVLTLENRRGARGCRALLRLPRPRS